MLSELQKRKLIVLFHCHDQDNDGFITKGDYEGFAKRVCELWNYAQGTPAYEELYNENVALWDYVQAVSDKDKDQRVSLDEFLASYDATLSDKALVERNVVGYAMTVLPLCDRDGDGKISGPEFVGLLGCYGVKQEAAQEAFRHLDVDGSGLLTTKEITERYRELLGDDPDASGNWLLGPY